MSLIDARNGHLVQPGAAVGASAHVGLPRQRQGRLAADQVHLEVVPHQGRTNTSILRGTACVRRKAPGHVGVGGVGAAAAGPDGAHMIPQNIVPERRR